MAAATQPLTVVPAEDLGEVRFDADMEKQVKKILARYPDKQAALLPVAYFHGTDFKPAKRLPAAEVTFWNQWGEKRP